MMVNWYHAQRTATGSNITLQLGEFRKHNMATVHEVNKFKGLDMEVMDKMFPDSACRYFVCESSLYIPYENERRKCTSLTGANNDEDSFFLI